LIFVFFALRVTAPGDEPRPSFSEAQAELFAARYDHAVDLYKTILKQEPATSDAWYGLVRAHLGLHHSRDAYAAADEALLKAPETAGAQTAAGLAMYRRGELAKAETFFRAALKIKPDYSGALRGMASVYSSIALYKTARDLRLRAYSLSPEDPELMVAHANTLKGDAHIKALETALAIYDPASTEARNLRIHVSTDRATGEKKLRRLVSPYTASKVRLTAILDGPRRQRGVGITLRLNGKQNATFLLDTGATGISLSPKLAEKAGLQVIATEASEARGIGDAKPQSALRYLASEVRAGDVVFADYPISVFRSAKSDDSDGLIGADVFERFLVTIDFGQLTLSLEPRTAGPGSDEDELVDWKGAPPAGFYRVMRFGDHLTVPTFINESKQSTLFLLDSGASSNIIDTDTARQFASVSGGVGATVVGIQGKVTETSRTGRVSLIFAGFRQDNPDLLAISLEKMGDSMGVGFGGILGMPVLGKLIVTLDYLQGVVKFDHRQP
jgi:tetratricopeptide (TPR) repeat protein